MDIYLTDLSQIDGNTPLIQHYAEGLSLTEKDRYATMTDEKRRLQFLTGRALIRDICHQSPVLLPNGKPTVSNGYISLSHSDTLVGLAYAKTPVGLDIEKSTCSRNFKAISNRLGFPLSDTDPMTFYRQFTRYEATFKLGAGQGPIYHNYYSFDTFIICISSLNNKEKIKFFKVLPFMNKTPLSLPFLGQEIQK